ncbi:hypothetical protein Ciccas_008615 [Cichlidogyrus casuarinus]|uniref:long-chain-fatty-acid--CoA ligase n=1 Tax=Cichlidogyrus casuarinus TaxID=1844966 RepID=A0ABD2PZJ4_9PLAT
MDSDLPSNYWNQTITSWFLTTFAIFFGVYIPLRWFLDDHKKSKYDESANPCTVVVNEEECIRTLNPHYKSRPEFDRRRNMAVYYDSVCDAIKDHLEKHPQDPVFGFHAKPSEPYQWINYSEFCAMFTEFGSGLQYMFDIQPGSETRMGIFGINCVEWMVAHFGMLFYSNIAIPLYNTLGELAIIHIIKLSKSGQ